MGTEIVRFISGTKDPEMSPHIYGHLIFGKGAVNIQWKRTASSTSCLGPTVTQHAEE